MDRRRQSMRRAVDPCLGFYLLPPATPARPVIAAHDPPRIDEHPPIVVLDPPIASPVPEAERVVSVDDFLRETALARSKSYKRRRRVPLARDASPDASALDSEDEEDSRPRSRKRRSLPLKKRLIRAAVATNTEPEDWLPPPQPLFLEPAQELPTKLRSLKLADPKKIVLPRSHSFTTSADLNSTSKQRSISGWETRMRIDPGARKAKRRAAKAAKPKSGLKCLPLQFIPLAEAERSYSLLKGPKLKHGQTGRPQAAARVPLVLSQPVLARRISPLPEASQSLLDEHALPPSTPPRSQNIPIDPPATTLAASSPIAPAPAPVCMANPEGKAPSVVETSSVGDRAAPCCPPRAPTLRPLGSFFQEFLETARAETQRSVESSARPVSRRRPGTRHNGNNTLAPPPRPISTMKSFFRSTVRESQASPANQSILSILPSHLRPSRSPEIEFRVPALPAHAFWTPSTRSASSPQSADRFDVPHLDSSVALGTFRVLSRRRNIASLRLSSPV
uniref:TPX2 central domain-containing protein n=1 Tax=Mycena chlorophos TaxID=658473 RepID=A0ABQ0MBP1_MYCCL|nr:predicted protein [Mycena chlorophos]